MGRGRGKGRKFDCGHFYIVVFMN
uniref:Uncharacterized protein n=1 Tax=Musa acuminata subsp. malaccensis TaxID=214687 RepID=A0A804KAY7_MUSAM